MDRRAVDLFLTTKGKEVRKQIFDFRNDCESKLLNNISKDKLEEIKKSFGLIINIL